MSRDLHSKGDNTFLAYHWWTPWTAQSTETTEARRSLFAVLGGFFPHPSHQIVSNRLFFWSFHQKRTRSSAHLCINTWKSSVISAVFPFTPFYSCCHSSHISHCPRTIKQIPFPAKLTAETLPGKDVIFLSLFLLKSPKWVNPELAWAALSFRQPANKTGFQKAFSPLLVR